MDEPKRSTYVDRDTKPRIEQLFNELVALSKRKQADYVGKSPDPLHNYRMSAELAGITTEQTLFARMCEKVMRVSSIMQNGGNRQVADETVDDTLNDIAVIAMRMREAREPQEGSPPQLAKSILDDDLVDVQALKGQRA